MFKNILKGIKKEIDIIKNSNTKSVSSTKTTSSNVSTKTVSTAKGVKIADNPLIKEHRYEKTTLVIVTTRNETMKFHPDRISTNLDDYIAKYVDEREAFYLEKDVFQNKIDAYDAKNPNHGYKFVIAHKPKDIEIWSGFYIHITEIKPVNGVFMIPNICDVFRPRYTDVNGTLKVTAEEGLNLKSAKEMFTNVEVNHLDLSGLDISGIGRTSGMFHRHKSNSVDVSNWDLSKIFGHSLSTIFRYIRTNSIIGLETWDTSTITNFTQVFYEAQCANLNVSNWSLASMQTELAAKQGITLSSQIFSKSKLGKIDLSKWDVSNVKHMQHWFINSKIESIGNISSWNVSNCCAFDRLFNNAKIDDKVDLSKWNIKPGCTQNDMLKGCSESITK